MRRLAASLGVWVLLGILVFVVVAGISGTTGGAGEPPGGDGGPDFCDRVWANSSMLSEAWRMVIEADLPAIRARFAGAHVDVETATMYVGLTDIEDEYTAPIRAIVSQVPGVRVEFFAARFTVEELRSYQSRIEAAVFGVTTAEVEALSAIEDEALREKIGVDLRERTRRRMAEPGVPPITLIGVDTRNNRLYVGLREVRPEYIEAITAIVSPEVPIEFVEGEFVEESGKTDRHRPMQGGIQLTSWDSSDTIHAQSTLGFRAVRTDGTVGFVMTGHAGWAGDMVWQPSYPWWWPARDRVGPILVNPPGARRSDAAFVATTEINPWIWPGRVINYWMDSVWTLPGSSVSMEGITSCGTSGVIRQTGKTVPSWTFGTLQRQVLATYPSALGDSGAPVFSQCRFGGYFRLHGIHVGRWTAAGVNYAVLSPAEGIQADLALHWKGPGPMGARWEHGGR